MKFSIKYHSVISEAPDTWLHRVDVSATDIESENDLNMLIRALQSLKTNKNDV